MLANLLRRGCELGRSPSPRLVLLIKGKDTEGRPGFLLPEWALCSLAVAVDQRKSRLATAPLGKAATRSGRRAAATRLTAPPVRSIRPRMSRAGAAVTARRWRSHTGGGQMT